MIKQSNKNSIVETGIKLLTVDDVKGITGIKSYNTLKGYMDREKTLPYRKIGKRRMFTIDDIRRFIDNQKQNT